MTVTRDRRRFLQFLGAGFTGAAGVHVLGPLLDARGQMPSPQPGGRVNDPPRPGVVSIRRR